MALTSGFYNAKLVNDRYDRVYDADDLSFIASCLVEDGIFVGDGNHFQVTVASGSSVYIAPGKAWFRNKWIYNDAAVELAVPPNPTFSNRIDAIVLDLNLDNTAEEGRRATFLVVSSEESLTPDEPVINADRYPNGGPQTVNNKTVVYLAYNGSTHFQYPLAYITRDLNKQGGALLQSNIKTVVGSNNNKYKVPWVTSLVDTGSKVEELYSNWVNDWEAFKSARLTDWNNFKNARTTDWNTFLNDKTTAWNNWFGATANAGVRKDWTDWFGANENSGVQKDYNEFKSDMQEWAETIQEIIDGGDEGVGALVSRLGYAENKIGDRNDHIIVLYPGTANGADGSYGTAVPTQNKVIGRLFFVKVQ